MGDFSKDKWIGGIVLPCIALVWGVSSLIAGEIILPIRTSRWLPSYQHMVVHRWPAVCISAALIFFAVYLHFNAIWSRYPKWERLAYYVTSCTGWIAGVLGAVGIFVWSMGAIVGVWQ